MEEEEKKSPNAQLAVKIVDHLFRSNLIVESNKAMILRSLETGGAKSEDWKLWVENATTKEEREDANAKHDF